MLVRGWVWVRVQWVPAWLLARLQALAQLVWVWVRVWVQVWMQWAPGVAGAIKAL